MRLHNDGGNCQDPENCDGAYDPTQPDMAPPSMTLHRDVDPRSDCGGQVSMNARELFNTDYWCVYCGAKWDEGKDNDRAREGSLPRTAVWANGYGVFHARVPRHAVAPLIAARRVLRDALVERYGDGLDPRCWRELERVEAMDTEDSIVYREKTERTERTESNV